MSWMWKKERESERTIIKLKIIIVSVKEIYFFSNWYRNIYILNKNLLNRDKPFLQLKISLYAFSHVTK